MRVMEVCRSFNSTMVRLKVAETGRLLNYVYESFNSTMVRLKVYPGHSVPFPAGVSIPLWFD